MSILFNRLAGGGAVLAALLAFAPLQARAAAHIETTAFSFDSASPGRADALIADANGAATFSLLGARDMLKYDAENPSGNGPYDHLYQGVFQLNVRAGYKITGYSLMGTFSGEHRVGQLPTGSNQNIMPLNWGAAYAAAGVAIRADLPATGGVVPPLSQRAVNLRGTQDFTLDSGPLDHAGPLSLYVEGSAFAERSHAEWWYLDDGYRGWDPSYAKIELSRPLLLTVYTQAVPEPHTYALTLAGLALIGGVLRRRRRLAHSAVHTDSSLKG
jgi:hypothetical protein